MEATSLAKAQGTSPHPGGAVPAGPIGPVPEASGGAYRVLATIEYPTDPQSAALVEAGYAINHLDRKFRKAGPGQVISDLLDADAEALIACGAIERVEA